MNTGGLILGGVLLLAAAVAFIWAALRLKSPRADIRGAKPEDNPIERGADEDVRHIFNDEFREELRNRGRLQFEKIIGENTALLQQDLRQTTGQLNEYMRAEITRTLQEEFKKYEQSIIEAKRLAQDSIDKTTSTIEQQRKLLEHQLQTQTEAQKARIIAGFEAEMASNVNHYLLKAVGNQIDLSDQLDFILAELEANKSAILEDIKRGT